MAIITQKLYYEDPFLSCCDAEILEINHKGVLCNKTVAYPEGGGQEGDRGVLIARADTKLELMFMDTQKGYGRNLLLPDFPAIQVDTPIYHVIQDGSASSRLRPGMRVFIQIDTERRSRLTCHHTGIHLLIMAIDALRAKSSSSIRGCHICTDYARVDYSTDERFTQDELSVAIARIRKWVESDAEIEVYPHAAEPEAWYWRLQDVCYPCGGTHLRSVGCLGPAKVKRTNMGRGLERLQIAFPECSLPLHLYHN